MSLHGLALIGLSLLAMSRGCETDDDCSLNGICDAGACGCDRGWVGARCDVLDLVPADSLAPAYPPPALVPNMTSWGASVIADDDGRCARSRPSSRTSTSGDTTQEEEVTTVERSRAPCVFCAQREQKVRRRPRKNARLVTPALNSRPKQKKRRRKNI